MSQTASHVISARGYAAAKGGAPLAPYSFQRRELRPSDVLIEISHCGICHSDIHSVRNEWGEGTFPMVPGHEIVGQVTRVGSGVTKFKVGQAAGVGCFVDSCRQCSSCREGLEQYCEQHLVLTYNSTEADLVTPTYGGYSNQIVVDENYLLRLPTNLDLARVAPLLCAGITTYSPMRHWGVQPGQRVAVVGLGGLGHMAVQFAAKFGAEVTVFSTSSDKEADARRLGAHHFVNARKDNALEPLKRSFDFALSTVSSQYALKAYLEVLKRDATLVVVGVPPDAPGLDVMALVVGRRRVAGSLIGGIKETQEMLDYCGKHNISSDVEVIGIDKVNEAYERVIKSDVRYRFVIDMKSLK